jgi:hypothetical protein
MTTAEEPEKPEFDPAVGHVLSGEEEKPANHMNPQAEEVDVDKLREQRLEELGATQEGQQPESSVGEYPRTGEFTNGGGQETNPQTEHSDRPKESGA